MAQLDKSTRAELLEKYAEILAETNQPFTYKTLPYFCTAWAEFLVVNPDLTHGVAYAKLTPQTLEFFDYGIGNRIQAGANVNHKANRLDTNLSRSNSTNGAFDFVIEALGLHCKNPRLEYAGIGPAENEDQSFVAGSDTIDPDVLNALQGEIDIYDPTAIATPQQLASPFFTGNVLWEALKNAGSCSISFDGSYFRELGVCANFALGAEGHPWHADSPPPDDLSLQIPEGLLWAKDGEPDSDCTFKINIPEPVIVPIDLIVKPGDGAALNCPSRIWLPIVVTLYGLEIGLPSSNG